MSDIHKHQTLPAQEQAHQPFIEARMTPEPQFMPRHRGADRLAGKVALITGGDSGIGRAVAIAMAREGADIAITYLEEHEDARLTAEMIEGEGARVLAVAGEIASHTFCEGLVDKIVSKFGQINILVNNAAEQHMVETPLEIETDQLARTFGTNVFGMFHLTRYALRHMREGAAIINTASVTAYKGSEALIDYSATKGAIVSFTRSLSGALAKRGIRVNAVAPGPIWTPLIPASFDARKVSEFGSDTPMGRPGQPNEVAPSYVFLASEDASYFSGQVLHPNGGTVVNG
jgi:NAD(P)-dependent dehydrogenase (short-subunit alcohol dehydrogenase family)